ncbi:MAG: acyl-CoA thioesterase [Planctomycetota bacterium]|jgi:YbgC/YbaW family acyl-CoA thioester hydrolase
MPGLVPRTRQLDLAAFDIPHPQPYLCDARIERGHLSRAVAHVSNIEFVRWMDRAAELHADHLGYTRQTMVDRGIMWFVVRHEIDYLAEAWPDDELVVATWVRDMRRVKSWRDTLVVRPADKTIPCRAATLWVLVDLATRRPTRIDDVMSRRFSPLIAATSKQRCSTSP